MTRAMPVLLLLTIALAGCRDAPEIVLAEARQALQARDEPAFVSLVEPRAAELLARSNDVVAKSGHTWKVLRDGRPAPTMLPKGEVSTVVENGKRAVVIVQQGTQQGQVPMRLVQGQWKIDLLEMDTFYQLVRPGE
jgi:hypothetical protein